MTTIYHRAIAKWGHEAQWEMVAEECLELALEIQRMARGRTTPEQLASELADVEIMLAQADIMLEGVEQIVPTNYTAKRMRGMPEPRIWAIVRMMCLAVVGEITSHEAHDPDVNDVSPPVMGYRRDKIEWLKPAIAAARRILGDELVDEAKVAKLARLEERLNE